MQINYVLLYGGATVAAVSVFGLMFFLLKYQFAAKKLRKQLDQEYGAPLGR